MGKLVVTEFVSIDGVFEDPGGAESYEHGGWTFEYDRGEDGDKFKLDELMEVDGSTGVPAGFGWDGGTGTTWRTDPAVDLTGIMLTQRAVMSPEPPELMTDFWRAAYAAIDTPGDG